MQPARNIFEEGQTILVNKPLEWTSFDVVKKIRNLIRIKKVGHAGTLDPLATGLLIVCTGKFTKRINEYMSQEKEYTGSFTLGAVTPTYDLESEPQQRVDIAHLDDKAIQQATNNFKGEIFQVPPIHSAIKIGGRPVYKLARKGTMVELEPRKVFIKEFDVTSIQFPIVRFRVVCSTGTYIRSLANDFGQVLGVGAYLSSLCRTRIGEFTIDQSMTMDEVEHWVRSLVNRGW